MNQSTTINITPTQKEMHHLQQYLDKNSALCQDILFHEAILQCNFDCTVQSIDRLDSLFEQLKNKGSIDILFNQKGHKNFILIVAVYIVKYIAKEVDQFPLWKNYEEIVDFLEDKDTPKEFIFSVGACFGSILCCPLDIIEKKMISNISIKGYIDKVIDKILTSRFVNIQDSAGDIFNNYLRKIRTGKLIDKTIAYYQYFDKVEFDFSMHSIRHIDRILLEIKESQNLKLADYEAFVSNFNQQALLMFLGCYVGATSSNLAKTYIKWANYTDMQRILENAKLVFCLEHNQVMLFDNGYFQIPVLSVTNALFGLTEDYPKSCESFVEKVIEENSSDLVYIKLNDVITSVGSIPQDLKIACECAGHIIGCHMLSIHDGDATLPTSIVFDKDSGKPTVVKHILDSDDDVHSLIAKLDTPEIDQKFNVLVHDVYANLPTARTDAVRINIRSYESKISLQLMIPYRNTNNPLGFAIYPMVAKDNNIDQQLLQQCCYQIYQSAQDYHFPLHEMDFWSRFYVDKLDLFCPPINLNEQQIFDPKDSEIVLFHPLRQQNTEQIFSIDDVLENLPNIKNINIEQEIQSLTPIQRRYLQVITPEWMKGDELFSQVGVMTSMYTKAKVVWGVSIQVNNLMFQPEKGSCSGEALFDPSGKASLKELMEYREKLFALKNTEPSEIDQQIYAEHLTNEKARLFNYQYPKSIADKPFIASSIWFWRRHLPDGMLSLPFFPILYHPALNGRIMLLPARFWPQELYQNWIKHSQQRHGDNFDLMPGILESEKIGRSIFDDLKNRHTIFPKLDQIFPEHKEELNLFININGMHQVDNRFSSVQDTLATDIEVNSYNEIRKMDCEFEEQNIKKYNETRQGLNQNQSNKANKKNYDPELLKMLEQDKIDLISKVGKRENPKKINMYVTIIILIIMVLLIIVVV